MSRLLLFFSCLAFATAALGQDLALEGFNKRFSLVKNEEGQVSYIKLTTAVRKFSIMPFIDQIKQDLLGEQAAFLAMNEAEKETEIDQMLYDMGLNPYALHNGEGSDEARKIKEALLNMKNIDVEAAFRDLKKGDFWKEFEKKLHEAFMFIDPSVLANLNDARFFYKRQVTYRVVVWALEQAKKHFSQLPILNIASFVIVRVHDMMMEQRHFHHNMLLHYFEVIPETKLGMTKEEVDRAVSSIYEYRIGAENFMESNKAAKDWVNYGMNNFYMQVRSGNTRIRGWKGPFSGRNFKDIRKLNFAFAQVNEKGVQKIYHLHLNAHQFSRNPALAYDFSKPEKVKRDRALLNLAGVALGFIRIPGWLKGNIENFLKSCYVSQVRMEGALVGHFESEGNQAMINKIYAQRANFYIVQ